MVWVKQIKGAGNKNHTDTYIFPHLTMTDPATNPPTPKIVKIKKKKKYTLNNKKERTQLLHNKI